MTDTPTTPAAVAEALRAAAPMEHGQIVLQYYSAEEYRVLDALLRTAADQLERLQARVERMDEALEPFANSLVASVSTEFKAQDWREEEDDTVVFVRTSSQRKGLPDLNDDATLSVGDFRRARAARTVEDER